MSIFGSSVGGSSAEESRNIKRRAFQPTEIHLNVGRQAFWSVVLGEFSQQPRDECVAVIRRRSIVELGQANPIDEFPSVAWLAHRPDLRAEWRGRV
jgi:hypothetical protein